MAAARELSGILQISIHTNSTTTSAPSALPLSRPFGEWDYAGPEADAVWAAIGDVERIWDERLGGGTAL